jgi:hypothetical protein
VSANKEKRVRWDDKETTIDRAEQKEKSGLEPMALANNSYQEIKRSEEKYIKQDPTHQIKPQSRVKLHRTHVASKSSAELKGGKIAKTEGPPFEIKRKSLSNLNSHKELKRNDDGSDSEDVHRNVQGFLRYSRKSSSDLERRNGNVQNGINNLKNRKLECREIEFKKSKQDDSQTNRVNEHFKSQNAKNLGRATSKHIKEPSPSVFPVSVKAIPKTDSTKRAVTDTGGSGLVTTIRGDRKDTNELGNSLKKHKKGDVKELPTFTRNNPVDRHNLHKHSNHAIVHDVQKQENSTGREASFLEKESNLSTKRNSNKQKNPATNVAVLQTDRNKKFENKSTHSRSTTNKSRHRSSESNPINDHPKPRVRKRSMLESFGEDGDYNFL